MKQCHFYSLKIKIFVGYVLSLFLSSCSMPSQGDIPFEELSPQDSISQLISQVHSAEKKEFYIAINGKSMMPSLSPGTQIHMVAVNDISLLQRNAVVVFSIMGADLPYVKRLVGLPGDAIEFIGDELHINGIYIQKYSDYLQTELYRSVENRKRILQTKEVPEGNCVVLGDNRSNAKDSMDFGFISCLRIFGQNISL